MSQATYTVTGMSCGHCADAVTSEITAIAGVRTVGVDVPTGQVTVTSDNPATDRGRPRGGHRCRLRTDHRLMAATTDDGALPTAGMREVELVIGGMTCASCPPRIERKLAKLAGVHATVNFATERAKVTYPPDLSTDDLVRVVTATGYTATPVVPVTAESNEKIDGQYDGLRSLRDRMRGSVALAIPVILLAMVPPLQFTNWQWLSLTLAAPVVTWGAWPFHKAAWTNARHGIATMD